MGGTTFAAERWKALESGIIQCELCPHACRIAPDNTGLCKVRRNDPSGIGGGRELGLPFYGAISGLGMDPIEKKPLHHFLPGSEIFSVGFVGCNLRCPFCQNWEISQGTERVRERVEPLTLVEAARNSGAPSIAYTYSEPLVHFEFVKSCMTLAREAGLANVLVTNGCLNEGPALELLALTDAANVDLKCWSAESYSRVLGGDREATLAFIRAASGRCHLEVTTLVVPSLSDSEADMDSIASFLAALDRDIPLHLSAYRPMYRHHEPPTQTGTLRSLAVVAKRHLRYVYIGNIDSEGSDTRCPSCGKLLVRRRGYHTELLGLDREEAPKSGAPARWRQRASSRCSNCGAAIPILTR